MFNLVYRRLVSSVARPAPSLASLVGRLRAETGQSFALCRKALEKAGMNLDVARQELDTLVQAQAQGTQASGQSRVQKQGLVGLVELSEHQYGLIELRCVTDFVARNPLFVQLASTLMNSLRSQRPGLNPEEHLKTQGLEAFLLDTVAKLKEPITVSKLELIETNAEESIGMYVHQQVSPGFGSLSALVGLSCPPVPWSSKLAASVARQVAAMNPKNSEALLQQEYIFDSSSTVRQFISQEATKEGFSEEILITKMIRYSL